MQFTLIESRQAPSGAFYGRLDDGRLWASGIHGCQDGSLVYAYEKNDGLIHRRVSVTMILLEARQTFEDATAELIACPCHPLACQKNNRPGFTVLGDWNGPTYWDIKRVEKHTYRISVEREQDE